MELKCRCLTVDGVVMDEEGKIALVKRKNEPFRGYWALPGGFVEIDESAEEAVVREVEEEIGIRAEIVGFIGLFTKPGRDERGTVSALFLLRAKGKGKAGSDAEAMRWVPIEEALKMALAFDHGEMVERALAWVEKELKRM